MAAATNSSLSDIEYTNETATTIYRGARRFSSSADSLELRVPAGQATTAECECERECERECQRKRSTVNHIFAAAYVATNDKSQTCTGRPGFCANGRA